MKLTEFFKTDYVNFSSYDNLRKIASLVDGQKNASRKILHTIQSFNIKKQIKVSQLGSKTGEFTEYLHGSMDDVIVNLGQDFTGTNNVPLLQKKGNFGTRFNKEASASRYIYTYGSDAFYELFNSADREVLVKQVFEGVEIEPKFFVPTLPVLLLNGAEGVSSGFAQKILPRNSKDVKQHVLDKLSTGSSQIELKPWFKNFTGSILRGENQNQYNIYGNVTRVKFNTVEIIEVPVGYTLKGYIKVLDALEDKGVIQSYIDKSENDKFNFLVKFQGNSLKSLSDDELLIKLKLKKTITENLTATDENNKIKNFQTIEELLDAYIYVKLQFVEQRRLNELKRSEYEINQLKNKVKFVESVLDGELVLNMRTKASIVKDLKNMGFLQIDGNFDYLLNMSLLALTKERCVKMRADVKNKQAYINKLNKTTNVNMWIQEIEALTCC